MLKNFTIEENALNRLCAGYPLFIMTFVWLFCAGIVKLYLEMPLLAWFLWQIGMIHTGAALTEIGLRLRAIGRRGDK